MAGPPETLPPIGLRAGVAGAGSLYLEGDSISIAVDGPAGEVLAGGCVREVLADVDHAGREARYDDLCAMDGGVALVARGTPAAPVRLEARGLRTVEWHHLAIACDAAAACPDGGARASQARGPPGQEVQVQELGYHRFATSQASAAGEAMAALVAAGGAAMDVASRGGVRLPAAEAAPGCACPALGGRTLQADGDVRLEGLRPAGDGRLQARLAGAAASARLDEEGIDPAALGLGVAGAVAAAGLLALLAKAAVALFSRLTPARSLENPRRQRVMDAIQAHPGIHERALARLTGQAPGTVRHHVAVLAQQGLVARVRDGKVVRLHDARPGPPGDPAAAALLEPALRRLDAWRREHPGASAAEAVRHAVGAWGWSRSTAYHRLARLDEALLVRS